MEMQTQWVDTTDQQRLCVRTYGQPTQPALVLVHGYPDHQMVWEPVIHYLTQNYFIVTYDVRGAGESSIPKKISDYRLARLSQDLEEVVNKVLPNRAFHLAAHDWGSIQSWESVTDFRFKGRILSYSTLSGPCLDHAAFWMREQFQQNRTKFLKQMSKSWYIAVFQLPWVAPLAWNFFNPQRWAKIVEQLEKRDDLPLNPYIVKDGKYGVNLYRANFLPRLAQPRQRFAICPVQAIVLQNDKFVGPDLIDEVSKWVDDFSRVELAANHWAILSQPEQVAQLIDHFIQKKSAVID
ncbi:MULTISPECIES: alpha/beta fold hydrolase [Acinetobacter]|uniref:Alpha/beta fold hydrolase n=1 Tax=Acinetobacter pecorum TaxID=2762215 RepID=A0ABR8VTC0_9GAMM|nr:MULTISPECIES: alpha/beta fold hydrolase [Acinetobacter]MBD8007751.1 alpha/beta fold hydrolase [Acinetobacter pecorum]OAL79344.1 alpha/beta hydrolase [Acinetobacter sp. SFA]OAL87320.1 alpha/beta hydrolase [Acinetobacter sp. SFD]